MAIAGPSLKLRRFRQRFGIGAPRLAIRAHVAWYWKLLGALFVLVFGFLCAFLLFEDMKDHLIAPRVDASEEIHYLSQRTSQLESEIARLRGQANIGENSLQIERATLQRLSGQLKALEQENASLREDLTFFEGLIPAPGKSGSEVGVRIEHLKIEPAASAGEYRYRMLVINTGQGKKDEFKGALQLLVRVKQDGEESTITIPSSRDGGAEKAQFSFETKYFRRLEGSFSVNSDFAVVGVEARLLQAGEVKAKEFVFL